MLPGKWEVRMRGSLGERFSSNSSFIGNHCQPAFAVSGKGKTSLNVFGGQVRKVIQDFLHAHSPTKIIKDIRHSDARAAYAGFAATNAWVDADAIFVVHTHSLVFTRLT